MTENFDMLINERKAMSDKLEELDHKLGELIDPVLEKRRQLTIESDEISFKLNELKGEINQLDVNIEKFMIKTGRQNLPASFGTFYMQENLSFKIIDLEGFFKWITEDKSRLDILKKDLLKKRETEDLINNGKLPNGVKPLAYTRIKFRKKGVKENDTEE